MEIIFIIIGYVLSIFLNRWLYLKLQKNHPSYYPNPPLVILCFMSLIGTLFIGATFLVESDIFKYKEK